MEQQSPAVVTMCRPSYLHELWIRTQMQDASGKWINKNNNKLNLQKQTHRKEIEKFQFRLELKKKSCHRLENHYETATRTELLRTTRTL